MADQKLLPPKTVEVVAELARTKSGSETFLAEASDQRMYWIKAPDSPQGSRTLVAEVVAYGIGRAIGAQVPENVLAVVPQGFSFRYSDGRYMQPGIAHGSRDIPDVQVSDDWDTYSHLDDNRRHQAFIAAMWDLCLGTDPQWLHQFTAKYSMWSFDHGFWFAGESDWDINSLRTIGTSSWQREIELAHASRGALNEAASRVDSLTFESLRTITGFVPLDWDTTSAELEDLAELLYARVAGVADRLRQAALHTRYP